MQRFTVTQVLLISLLLVSVTRAEQMTAEHAPMATLLGFFDALSVENYPSPNIQDWVTDDFLIFEMGQAFSWDDFSAFLAEASYDTWVSTEWRLSDARVSLSDGAAHISYVNRGEFVYPDPDNPGQQLKESNMWLESVYLINEEGQFRIKFLQSDNVSRVVESLP
jgi:hypothetical protein